MYFKLKFIPQWFIFLTYSSTLTFPTSCILWSKAPKVICTPHPHKVSLVESEVSLFSVGNNTYLAPGFSWIFVSFCEMDSMMFTNPITKTSYVSAQCFYIIWVVTAHGLFALSWSWNRLAFECRIYHKTSNTSRTLSGNNIVDHSDVVGASPVGAAPSTSSLST